VSRTRTIIIGDETDPAFRSERSHKAGVAAHSTDSLIGRILRRAPELTPEQLDRLAALFADARTGQAERR
jgi:hypothetical protein